MKCFMVSTCLHYISDEQERLEVKSMRNGEHIMYKIKAIATTVESF